MSVPKPALTFSIASDITALESGLLSSLNSEALTIRVGFAVADSWIELGLLVALTIAIDVDAG